MTCPFCDVTVQMPRLHDGEHVYVMPNKFPLRPGHLLIVTKAHEESFATLAPERAEMLELAARLRDFVRDTYGEDSAFLENGPGNQTVPHAHAHVIPLRATTPTFPDGEFHALDAADPWTAIEEVHRSGQVYRYLAWNGDHRLQLGGNFANPSVLRWIFDAFEIKRGPDGRPLRPYLPEQIDELVSRWQRWSAA